MSPKVKLVSIQGPMQLPQPFPDARRDLAEGVSLGLAVMTCAKVRDWCALDGQLPEYVVLGEPEQREAMLGQIARAQGWLEMLNPGPGAVTIAVCPVCERVDFASNGKTQRCVAGLECTGAAIVIKTGVIVR